MSTKARIVVLVVSLLAVVAPSAHAVTWHNSGDTAFTASTILPGFGTLSATGHNMTCATHNITGTASAGPFAGTTWPAAQLTSRYTGCSLVGQPTTLHCQQAFTAESQSGRVTSGTIDTLCDVYIVNTSLCRVEGTQAATYTNPTAGFGTFTLSHTAGLRVTNGAVLPCLMGPNDIATWTPRTLTVSAGTGGPVPHTGPVFARTP